MSQESNTYRHPIHISDLFTPNAQSPTNVQADYTVDGLAKLLLFNAYTKAKSDNASDFIMDEARKYPYTKKEEIEVIVMKLDISNSYSHGYLGADVVPICAITIAMYSNILAGLKGIYFI